VPYDYEYEQLREFVAGGSIKPAAPRIEAYAGGSREAAPRKARRGFRTEISLDEMVARNRSLVDRVRPIVDRVMGRLRARFDHK
jgi:hypothetical protein